MSTKEYVYNDHLKELHSSDFEMRKGEPDIRNWKVTALHNQEIGHVTELLFDDASHRIRYIVVELIGKQLNLVSRSVLIPSGLAVIHEKDQLVSFPGLTVGHLASLPVYDKGKVTIETEREIRNVFAPSKGIVYRDEDYNEQERLNRRDQSQEDNSFLYDTEVVEKVSLKEEIKENIEKVKETVRKMENDVDKLGKYERP